MSEYTKEQLEWALYAISNQQMEARLRREMPKLPDYIWQKLDAMQEELNIQYRGQDPILMWKNMEEF